MVTRRSILAGFANALSSSIRLEASTYGMQPLPVMKAMEIIRQTGYDGAEFCCMPDWPSEPKKLDTTARRQIRDFGLPIPTLIESFNLMVPKSVPERIRAAAELGHDISPKSPPMLQTVLGGKEGEWEQSRDTMAARLHEWADIAEGSQIRLAVKAHANSACDNPEKLIWLLDKVKHPALTAIYDYSHFQVVNLGLEETLDALLPRSAFLTVKDSKVTNGKPQFLLPGDGTTDYMRYFRKVKSAGWKGWVLVEVSRQLQTQPGFDPVETISRSYAHLAPILKSLGLRV